MRRAFGRDRRIVGRPARARFHRDAAAGGRLGTQRHAVLAGAARRYREPERRADALADRMRAIAAQPARRRAPGAPAWDAELFRARGMPPGRWTIAHEERIASIWLPALAIERWAKTSDCPPDSPVVLTIEGTHGPIIHAVTKAAAERGARPGARLTDARALDPALVAVPADPEGDSALLQRLARWAGRWSPLVEVDGDGCAAARRQRSRAFVRRRGRAGRGYSERGSRGLGFTVRIAIAPTAAAAWALARLCSSPSGEGRRVATTEGAEIRAASPPARWHPKGVGLRRLASPVSALRLEPDTVRTLERLGLKTIGALIDMPRLALARRFRGAEDVVDALDRMLGPQGRTADRRAQRSAAARGAAARGAGDPSRSARARRSSG